MWCGRTPTCCVSEKHDVLPRGMILGRSVDVCRAGMSVVRIQLLPGLVNVYITNWKDPPIFIAGKTSTISTGPWFLCRKLLVGLAGRVLPNTVT